VYSGNENFTNPAGNSYIITEPMHFITGDVVQSYNCLHGYVINYSDECTGLISLNAINTCVMKYSYRADEPATIN
jgi:hypothetical protein